MVGAPKSPECGENLQMALTTCEEVGFMEEKKRKDQRPSDFNLTTRDRAGFRVAGITTFTGEASQAERN